jgi:predicted nucleic acid-binding protein
MTTVVLDASAVVAAFVENTGRGHRLLARIAQAGHIAVPAHYHVEAASALRGMERGGVIDATAMLESLRDISDLPVTPYHVVGPLLDRAIQLRANATVYDALYIALAEQLDCSVVTADGKLAAIAGIRCSIEVFAA